MHLILETEYISSLEMIKIFGYICLKILSRDENQWLQGIPSAF